jgi:bifunctional ADP-heptose synthase (sugar kinase/adenylyltransferase)
MRYTDPRILVIGDKCTDDYTYGTSERLCPDVPAPVFKATKSIHSDGMAGNVARQLVAFGAHVDTKFNEEFICKKKYIDERTNYTFLRVDIEPKVKHILAQDLRLLLVNAKEKWDAIVVSDYGKGYLNHGAMQHICESHPLVFVDTKKKIDLFLKDAAFIKINEPEWKATKDNINPNDWKDTIIVTLGSEGCMYNDRVYPITIVDVHDVSGAGDTFLAALVMWYTETEDINKAIEYANNCAMRAVQKKGVAVLD